MILLSNGSADSYIKVKEVWKEEGEGVTKGDIMMREIKVFGRMKNSS